jgi:hypothetical protein
MAPTNWKRLLDELSSNEENLYVIPYPKDPDGWVESFQMGEADTEHFINTTNFDKHTLAKKLKISSQEFKTALNFMIRNKLIEDPGSILYENQKEPQYSKPKIPIMLTTKGFDLAIENQKQKLSNSLAISNIFLTFYATLFASMIVATSVSDFMEKLGASKSDSVYAPLFLFFAIEMALMVGFYVAWKAGKKF